MCNSLHKLLSKWSKKSRRLLYIYKNVFNVVLEFAFEALGIPSIFIYIQTLALILCFFKQIIESPLKNITTVTHIIQDNLLK